jgi:uncharacterized membrane protein
MTSGFVWTVVGSVAGVTAVVVAIFFGISQVRAARRDRRSSSSNARQIVEAGRDAYVAGRDQDIRVERPDDG